MFCQSTCLANRLCSGPRKFTKLLKPPLSYLWLQQVTVAGSLSGPRKFTKLLKPPLSYLWLQQVTVAGSLDDLITLGRRFIKCERNITLL